MTPNDIRVELPRSLDELWEIRARAPRALLFMGGTDLLVKRRKGLIGKGDLICLERIDELRRVLDQGDTLFIGAGCSCAMLLEHRLVSRTLPVLARALEVLGSPPIRNMASIGGNICTASPAADTLPALMVLDAQVEIRSPNGRRRLAIADFIIGPGRTDLRSDEILYGVRIPKWPRFTCHHYEKVGQRNALSISIVGLAAVADLAPERVIREIRLAWGSVAPTIVRSPAVEEALRGKTLEQKALEEVFPLVERAVSPMDDVRASAFYRTTLCKNLLLRLAPGGAGE